MAIPESGVLLICYLHESRKKARACGVAEALALLQDLDASAPTGGPLGDQAGVFWLALPETALEEATARFPRLGYTWAVDRLRLAEGQVRVRAAHRSVVQWRGVAYKLQRLFEEDEKSVRASAPDRRLFAMETPQGTVRLVKGYRGDSRPMTRRALPVCDARLLVNLVRTAAGATFLDPFAGAGGIILEALASGYRVLSADIDPVLRAGLERFGTTHHVADARHLPLADASVDCIATEPPYAEEADAAVVDALAELQRVLKPGGKLALLSVPRQAAGLRQRALALGMNALLDTPLNRKGLPCAVLVWQK